MNSVLQLNHLFILLEGHNSDQTSLPTSNPKFHIAASKKHQMQIIRLTQSRVSKFYNKLPDAVLFQVLQWRQAKRRPGGRDTKATM